MPEPSRRTDTPIRVEFSTVEDARRVIFAALTCLSDRDRAKQASVIAAKLRDAGLLGESVEQHYSAADAASLIGQRSSAWAVKHAKLGAFGPCVCDGGDWLIPASGLNKYLAAYIYIPRPQEEAA